MPLFLDDTRPVVGRVLGKPGMVKLLEIFKTPCVGRTASTGRLFGDL
jgi:hypothetical protein